MTLEKREECRPISDVAAGFQHLDRAALDERHERVGERDHAVPPAPFNRHRKVRRRALREHARDRRRVQQQFTSRDTAAARLGQQDLSDDASQGCVRARRDR